jgi:hypothetical protein
MLDFYEIKKKEKSIYPKAIRSSIVGLFISAKSKALEGIITSLTHISSFIGFSKLCMIFGLGDDNIQLNPS